MNAKKARDIVNNTEAVKKVYDSVIQYIENAASRQETSFQFEAIHLDANVASIVVKKLEDDGFSVIIKSTKLYLISW